MIHPHTPFCQVKDLFFTIPADWHFKSGDALHAFFSPDIVFKRLFEPFPIAPGVVLNPGEYRFARWLNTIATSGRRPLSATVRWSFGSYWSGDAHELHPPLPYKSPPRLSVSATAKDPGGLGLMDVSTAPSPGKIFDRLTVSATAE